LGAQQQGTAPKVPRVIRAEASALMARGSFGACLAAAHPVIFRKRAQELWLFCGK